MVKDSLGTAVYLIGPATMPTLRSLSSAALDGELKDHRAWIHKDTLDLIGNSAVMINMYRQAVAI